MQARLEKEVRLLKVYAIGSSLLLIVLVASAFIHTQNERFEEITVERINVVEPNGQPALVVANSRRLPGAIINGQKLSTREGIPGIIFYNGEGDETGGLIFDSERTDSTRAAFGHLSFDRYKQDQVVALQYVEESSSQRAGLRVLDRPSMSITDQFALQEAAEKGDVEAQQRLEEAEQKGNLGALRVFVGTQDKTAALRLQDRFGNERIRIYVDSSDAARMEFLNKDEEVIYSLPERE